MTNGGGPTVEKYSQIFEVLIFYNY